MSLTISTYTEPSNHVEITGFDRNKSTFNTETNLFEQLVFDLSDEPSTDWMTVFLCKKYESHSNTKNLLDYSFYNKKISSGNVLKMSLKDLQQYIDQLKERFHLTNMYFINLEREELNKKEDFTKTIESLKF